MPQIEFKTTEPGDTPVTSASPLPVTGTVLISASEPLSVDDGGDTLSVDDGAGSLTIDNAALSVVGGGVEATAQRVTIASDSTGVLSVDDNGASLTVDGTVAVSSITTDITPGTGAAHLGKAEDGGHTTGDTGVAVWAVRKNTEAALSGADADYSPFEVDSDGRLYVAQPSMWAVQHTPATNTQATISKAAGGGTVRHVCTSISATISAPAAPTAAQVIVNLRDGATGAGTILLSWTGALQATAGDRWGVVLSGLNIVGTANTAMTLEFTAAGGANTYEQVAMSGYDKAV